MNEQLKPTPEQVVITDQECPFNRSSLECGPWVSFKRAIEIAQEKGVSCIYRGEINDGHYPTRAIRNPESGANKLTFSPIEPVLQTQIDQSPATEAETETKERKNSCKKKGYRGRGRWNKGNRP